MAEPTSKSSGMDTIDPTGKHPDNAVYVAKDRKSGAEVSFDSWGRKLDSNGNVVHGDRQRAGDAGAKVIRRLVEPDVPKGPPAQPSNGYVIGAGISPAPAQRSGWDNSVLPGTASAATARPANFNVPNRAELNNNWLYGAGKLEGAGGWESGGTPLERQWRSPAQSDAQSSGWDNSVAAPTQSSSAIRMPWESFEGEYQSPITRESMVAVPGFGMIPGSAEQPAPNRRFIPNEDMPYPPTGSYQGRYYPETYTRPNVPVYDPNQLSWGVP